MKQTIANIPFFGAVVRGMYRKWVKPFPGSEQYWIQRYKNGGNSGCGSYNKLAEFKAEILNTFVYENNVTSIIEYGCGDGNQLALAQYPKYIGFDVSSDALSRCFEIFSRDETKSFKLLNAYEGETAELTLSLDVIFHLVEDIIFVNYMNRLFDSSMKFVIIYSSDIDNFSGVEVSPHVKHRNFSKWVKDYKKDWKLIKHIPNKYSFNGDEKNSSFADFYIYVKK